MKRWVNAAINGMFTIFFLLLMLVLLPIAAAQEPPPNRPHPPSARPGSPPGRSQPPSPQLPTGSDSTGYRGDLEPDIIPCSTIHGFVTNWGYRNEPDVPINLNGSNWQAQKFTDDNGYYASDCLGVGIGLVNPVTPPWLNPLVEDVAVRLDGDNNFEINLGLYSSEMPTLPIFPRMAAGQDTALPGETVTFTIWLTNPAEPSSFGGQMENVFITDLLDDALVPEAATTSVGTVEIWDNLVTANLGTLSPGQTAIVEITAWVREDAVPPPITTKASVIYRDHVVVQTQPVTVEVHSTESQAVEVVAPQTDAPKYLPETGGNLLFCP